MILPKLLLMDMAVLKQLFIFVCLYPYTKCTYGERHNACEQQVLPKVFDYIVVGAGAAGATIAARLSEDSQITVCLLEAGIKDTDQLLSPTIETPRLWSSLSPGPVTWNYTTVPQNGLNGRTIFTGMGKIQGGSTSHNAMLFARGFKADFDHWAASGATGWGYDDIFHFFLKMENNVSPSLQNSPLHNTCGPFTVSQTEDYETLPLYHLLTRTAKEVGINMVDCNGPSPFGMCKPQYSIKNGKRESTSTAYLQPAMGRRNLYVVTEALVEKILITRYHKKAVGIRYLKKGHVHYMKARHEVIVSGGAYGSPQLLQLSGIGPRSLLRRLKIRPHVHLPVGNNYQDHPSILMDILLDIPTPSLQMLNDPLVLAEYVFKRKGIYAEPTGQAVAAYFDTLEQQLNWPEAFALFIDGINPQPKGSRRKNGTSIYLLLSHPQSRGSVQIKSRDPNDPPLIDPQYLQEEIDVKTTIDVIRRVQGLLKSPSMKVVNASFSITGLPDVCRNLKSDSNKQWECILRNSMSGSHHPASTCKMGSKYDQTAVVDPQLRVKGLKGLRVADASIMPEVTSASLMVPTIMIGEKAADMIRKHRMRMA